MGTFENQEKSFERYEQGAYNAMGVSFSRFNEMLRELDGIIQAIGVESIDEFMKTSSVEEMMDAIDIVIDGYGVQTGQLFTDLANEMMDLSGEWGNQLGLTEEDSDYIRGVVSEQAAINDYYLIRKVMPQVREDIMMVFQDAAMEGWGPERIQEEIIKTGLEYSPKKGYSPAERAWWIYNEETSRIYNSINDNTRRLAKIKYCYNRLSQSVKNHSKQCIAATAAELITVEQMKDIYGLPHRHFGCRCSIRYVDKKYYKPSRTEQDLIMVKNNGQDVDDATAYWKDHGTQEKAAEDARKNKLREENEYLDKQWGETPT